MSNSESENTINITDIDKYLNQLSLSCADKIDFISNLSPKVNTIVDFGCADGSVISVLKKLYPQYTYVGIETNLDFIKKAQSRLGDTVKIYKDINDFVNDNDIEADTIHINMSSVIHEIFSYHPKPRLLLSDLIRIYDFQSFSIREMIYNKSPIMRDIYESHACKNINKDDDKVHMFNQLNIFKNICIKVLEKCLCDDSMRKKLHQFLISRKSELKNTRILLEFLLKYFYDENWEKECNEKYFIHSYDVIQLHNLFVSFDYRCISNFNYTLPYLKEKWCFDFKFNEQEMAALSYLTTHRKLFYRKLTDEELVNKYDENGHIIDGSAYKKMPPGLMVNEPLYIEMEENDINLPMCCDEEEDVPADPPPPTGEITQIDHDQWVFTESFNRHYQSLRQERIARDVRIVQERINTLMNDVVTNSARVQRGSVHSDTSRHNISRPTINLNNFPF